MEDAKNLKENGPPESAPAPELTSPEEDQSASAASTTSDGIEEQDVSEAAPKAHPVSSSPIADTELGAPVQNHGMPAGTKLVIRENNQPLEAHKNNNMTSLSESRASRTIGVEQNRASGRPIDDASDGHAVPRDASTSPARDVHIFKPQNEEIVEAKIVARPSPEDDFMPPVSGFRHKRNTSMDHLVAKVPPNYHSRTHKRSKTLENIDLNRGQVDTAAPFESVKAAVSKFGGIVDWKAHRVQTVERRKFIKQELEKAREEIPSYKKRCEAAEEAKIQVLRKLDSSRRLIEELKLNLERAQKEEEQAKQDSELAKLRVEEMERGIADEGRFAAKAQLEVARARHAAAASELKTVKDELEQLRKDYALLLAEKDAAMRKVEEAVSTSKEAEKSVEDLTNELVMLKQSLEFLQSAHLEAEEHRIEAVMADELESLNWEEELRQAEEELERLNRQMLSTKDLKSKLGEETALLQDLKGELAACVESKLEESDKEVRLEDMLAEPEKKTHGEIEVAITAAEKELAEVKQNIKKATDEVNSLKVSAASLKSELDKERTGLAAIQQREGMASTAIASLEAELSRTKSQIALFQTEEKEERQTKCDLPKRLQEEAREAAQAKALVQAAHNEFQKAREEAEQAKAGAITRESRLRAAQKEIEAAKASEKLAQAAINALEESESTQRNNDEDSPTGVTLSLEEYYELSKRAYEAEVQANTRVAAALSQVEAAKESESWSLNRVEEVCLEISSRKNDLEVALQKAERAEEGKLTVEQELREWRAEHEQRRKAMESVRAPANTIRTPRASFEERKESNNSFATPDSPNLPHQRSTPRAYTNSNTEMEASAETKVVAKKKKRSFFPRILMFLTRRRTHTSKSA